MSERRSSVAVGVLAMIGILLSGYLLWEQASAGTSLCNINSVVNCNAVISGPVAKTLGIPTPLYGFAGYAIILFAAVTGRKGLAFGVALGASFFAYGSGTVNSSSFRSYVPCALPASSPSPP